MSLCIALTEINLVDSPQEKWRRYQLEQVESSSPFDGFPTVLGNFSQISAPPAPHPTPAVLTCNGTDMSLVLPIATLTNIELDQLQLNSPSCKFEYNATHLVANIPLNGCGTKTVVRI